MVVSFFWGFELCGVVIFLSLVWGLEQFERYFGEGDGLLDFYII